MHATPILTWALLIDQSKMAEPFPLFDSMEPPPLLPDISNLEGDIGDLDHDNDLFSLPGNEDNLSNSNTPPPSSNSLFDTETVPQEPKPVQDNSPVVGIDLGTTFSCVAVWENDRPVVIANSLGNRTTPSWVSFHKDNTFVGEAAKTKASRAPHLSIYDAKRMIGRKVSDHSVQQSLQLWPFVVTEYRGNCSISLEDQGKKILLTPEEVSAYILAKMKHTAEDYLGRTISRAVITVPAYFNDAQRQATIDAATIAGLQVERIINEPTAAALAYGVEKKTDDDKPQTILVYDLGGGTLDVTVLIIDGPIFEVKSTSGDTHLGGQDFDNNLVQHFIPQVEEQCQEDISRNAKALKKLRDACQTLKHNLSHSESGTVEVDALVNGEDFDAQLTREQFVDINKYLFDRCLEPVNRAIKDANIDIKDIDEVVLIGGSTRIVKIQEMLSERFPGKRLSKRINPDEAVAMGAAIQGANLTQKFDERNPKLAGITLMDVTPISLGIELANRKMSVLIHRNTTIPYSHTRIYKNNEDYQTEATVEVFEGEEKVAKRNRLLGKFTLPGLPPRLRGQVQIPVTFTINSNGVLEVSASVSGEAGSTKKLVIKKDKGLLTEDEIRRRAKLLENWERKCRDKKLN